MIERLPALAFADHARHWREAGNELIPVQGVPNLPMPEHVVEAVAAATGQVHSRQSRGSSELRELIAATLSADHDMAIDPTRDLLITHGAQHGMSVALRALLSPGSEVVIPAPTYFFDGMVRTAGLEPRYVATQAECGWRLDCEAIGRAITPRTSAIIICNPNNPTGSVPTRRELSDLLDLADRHDLYVFSDESYERYVHESPGYVPLRTLRANSDRVVTVTSLSKNYAFTMWRVGYVHSSAVTVDMIHRAFEWDAINVGDVPQAAACAAIAGPQGWLDAEFATLMERRDVLHAGIEAAGLSAVRPAAGVFTFVDFTRLGMKGEVLEDALLQAGISGLGGDGFKGPSTHVRLLYGADIADVKLLGKRLGELTG
ncbi:aspartate aminotransferase [Prescottella equi]|uniref:pyridoxal phosphate-dependent aminotransferase n=1 Tax=Rhodococcus hoagii TaxID=43767 RepID=UPI000A0F63E6|nr:pyridoxal phosphate-dependent aminotransferase [Prescottella equi]ORJ92536.1 aspartate aminotransferase [Prescottella equi]